MSTVIVDSTVSYAILDELSQHEKEKQELRDKIDKLEAEIAEFKAKENSMSVKPFSEIEAEFDLSDSDFKREWHSKKTKLAKMFWITVCHNNALSTVVKRYSEGDIAEAYVTLFYRPLDAFNWIRKHYDREKTSDIEKAINFEELEAKYINSVQRAMNTILDLVSEIPIPSQTDRTTSENLIVIDIEKFDGRHPELSSVSECFSLLTESGAFRRIKNYVYTMNFDLKSHHIKELNKAADEMVRSEIILTAILDIKRHVKKKMDIFKMKTEVQGATEALQDALLHYPGFMHLSDKQKKYQLRNRYYLNGGDEIEYLGQAIYRKRKK